MNVTENMLEEFRLVSKVKSGFWWCNECFKVTTIRNLNESIMHCNRCGSVRIKFCQEDNEEVKKPFVIDYAI